MSGIETFRQLSRSKLFRDFGSRRSTFLQTVKGERVLERDGVADKHQRKIRGQVSQENSIERALEQKERNEDESELTEIEPRNISPTPCSVR